jgi:beta-phosphoglucomutase
MLNIDTIIFDCEGIIVDTETIWDKGQEEFLRRRGCSYERSKIKPMLTGRSVLEGVLIMQNIYGFDGDPKRLSLERIDIVKELFRTETTFIKGFQSFFCKCRNQYKTCVATAMDDVLLDLVDERLGLSCMFGERIFTLTHVKHRSKPNPDIFLYSADQIGSKPSRCMVIEDSPHGIEAARRAGMKSTAITTTYPEALLKEANFIVNTYAQIDISAW